MRKYSGESWPMQDKNQKLQVALVHDWLIHMRGGERVLEAMAELYPDAEIYTLFCNRKKLSAVFQGRRIHTSFLQWLPGIRLYYRWLLPLLPLIIKTLRVAPVDVVLSTSHCVAKAVPVPDGALHICYCHTPMRYLWGFGKVYFQNIPFFLKPFLFIFLKILRHWDSHSNDAVHAFIANSENVRQRILKYYGRDAAVIHPPVGTNVFYRLPDAEQKDYYLVISAFVPYKRVDLVIEAFNEIDRTLLIVGKGPLENEYQRIRKNTHIRFLGSVPDAELRTLLNGARALIFPTEEDFGIVPLEAQACGCPVIALEKGGALESVKTGLFFKEQTTDSLSKAILSFEKTAFDRTETARKIQGFSKEAFKDKIDAFIKNPVKDR